MAVAIAKYLVFIIMIRFLILNKLSLKDNRHLR